MQNSHVSKLVLSSQCIFPAFACIFLVLYFVYLIESEPVNFGKKLNRQADDSSPDDIKHAALSKVWIIVTISILFTAGVIAADIGALVEYTKLPEEIKSYFNDHSNSASKYLYMVPISMTIFDSVSFFLFIICPSIVACNKCCQCIHAQEQIGTKPKCYKVLCILLKLNSVTPYIPFFPPYRVSLLILITSFLPSSTIPTMLLVSCSSIS